MSQKYYYSIIGISIIEAQRMNYVRHRAQATQIPRHRLLKKSQSPKIPSGGYDWGKIGLEKVADIIHGRWTSSTVTTGTCSLLSNQLAYTRTHQP